jgi:hypothetical protein
MALLFLVIILPQDRLLLVLVLGLLILIGLNLMTLSPLLNKMQALQAGTTKIPRLLRLERLLSDLIRLFKPLRRLVATGR